MFAIGGHTSGIKPQITLLQGSFGLSKSPTTIRWQFREEVPFCKCGCAALVSSVTWRPYVDGTTHERATAPRLADNVEEVRAGPAQLMNLSDATSEVLKAFSGGSSGQRFIAAIQPARTKYTHLSHLITPTGRGGRKNGT